MTTIPTEQSMRAAIQLHPFWRDGDVPLRTIAAQIDAATELSAIIDERAALLDAARRVLEYHPVSQPTAHHAAMEDLERAVAECDREKGQP